ncbi:MAG: nitroreductase family protein, partial [Rhizobacter sp.]|nr:nitroreductase family protein [Rhizobacter sp.]
LRPGAYAYDAAAHRLLPRRAGLDLRGAAQAAALDQEVIGAAAVVFVLSVDRAAFAADPAGPARGYRHAFIEAGMVGERIYLEAGARGLAACAVGAFYDDEAVALAGLDATREWPVHFAALGWPTG